MNSAVIKELYSKAYSEIIDECEPTDAIALQNLKRDAEEKLSAIMSKATSDETKKSLRELSGLYNEQIKIAQLITFTLGFRKGAQLMNDIIK